MIQRLSWTERLNSAKRNTNARGCWLWDGVIHGSGYAHFFRKSAHIRAYIELVGLVPEGMELDHLCRNRHCVNPAHLEPVSHLENVLRGIGPAAVNARRTHCTHGHELAGENLQVTVRGDGRKMRQCKECNRRWQREHPRKRVA